MEKSMHSLPHYASINDKPLTRRSSAFDFRAGSDVCPTCGGTGKVPKGQQEELVALIPYKDERLKPRRTCLIVIIFLLIIVVMVITATLLAVFLSPRNVTFTCNNVLITNWTNISRPGNEEPAAHMTLQVHGMAKNYNYISITMKDVNITVNRDVLIVGYSTLQQLSVSARQHKQVLIDVNASYKPAEAQKVRFSCQTWKSISVEIMIVSTYKYLSHTSNTEDTSHFYVSCNWNETAT